MDTTKLKSLQAETHFRDYWRVVWNGRWTVLSIFAVVSVLGTVATLLQKPMYEGVAVLEINARPRGVVPGAEIAQMGTSEWGYLAEERYFNTQHEILKSRSVAAAVLDKLGLRQHPGFRDQKDPEQSFIDRVIVDPVSDTGVVRVRVSSGDPQEAATWANELANTYVKRNLDEAVKTTEEAVTALIQRLQPMKEDLLRSEQERFEFAGEQALFTEDPTKSAKERLTTLEADLTTTQMKRLELQGVYEKIQEIERNGGDYFVIPQVASDPTVRALTEDRIRFETELRRMLVTFKAGHYKVKEKESEIDKLNQKIDSEIQRIVGAIQTEYSLASGRETDLNRTIAEAKAQSVQLGRTTSEYEAKRSQSTENRKIYDLISTRIKEVQLNAHLLRNNVAVMDPAIVPTDPVSPKRRLDVALSLLLGLILGLGVVFALDYLDNTVKTSEDVEQYLGMSILAIVPRKGVASDTILKESFQSLRTNLGFSSLNHTRRVLLMTSAGPQEGKTTTAVSLARTQAAAGDRVILVDCDLRRPNVHNLLNVKRNPGLTNYLADGSEENSWRNYVKPTDSPNMQVLTCGPIPPNAPELFGTDRFRRLLDELKEAYEWVVIDSPPTASLTDSLILASMVDMVAFVIRHRENDKELIRRCVESIRSVNEHVVGAILNNVDLDRSHYSDYYYAGYYYYGAGESEEKKDPRKGFLRRRKVG
jgi:capsular exopolysaccharide synthesis family protein